MFPAFSSLSSAWLFALLVPLIAFYFLKLKRPQIEIPSLVLWRQVLNDQRVNSPFQRFKRNFLLLLQILILVLLVLAAMQPFLRREASRAHRLPVLIDVSASMGALDRPGGRSRLDEAKQSVREMIDGLLSDQEVSLVAFGQTARRLTPFTNNHRELREALDSLTVEDVPGALDEGLRLVQALSRSAPFDKVRLISDGNFPAQTSFELPFQIDYQKLPPGGSNFGIVACNARRASGGRWQIFVQLAGSANAESTTGSLELWQQGRLLAHEDVALARGSTPRLSFEIAGNTPTTLQARLNLQGFDSLASDNTAWLSLPEIRPLTVFVPESLAGYRHALAALGEVTLFPEASNPAPPSYDLLISDQATDLAQPARVRCSLGFVPQELKSLVTVENKNSQAIDWRRDSTLLQHVSLRDVVFMDQPTRTGDPSDQVFAQRGWEILAQGEHGPLILQKASGETLDLALLFHTDRSTLPYRVGFPILVSNLVQIAWQQTGLAETKSISTGVLPALAMESDHDFTIETPDHRRTTLRSDARGQLSGIAAPLAGEYTISGGSAPLTVGASLLSTAETSLAAVERIEFNDQLSVAASTAPAKSDRSFWWSLAFAGFLALLVEWWWFQRRASLRT